MNRRSFFNLFLISPILGLFGYKSIKKNEIPAFLHNGEYILRTQDAEKMGVCFFNECSNHESNLIKRIRLSNDYFKNNFIVEPDFSNQYKKGKGGFTGLSYTIRRKI